MNVRIFLQCKISDALAFGLTIERALGYFAGQDLMRVHEVAGAQLVAALAAVPCEPWRAEAPKEKK
jgi:hypothetical protein